MFPGTPNWQGLHPIVVHFPIALLLIAPIFVVIGAASRRARQFSVAALILMVVGTGALFLAMATGEAAEDQVATEAPSATATLERHEELAEMARIVFSALTGLFGVLVVAAVALRDRVKRPVIATAHIVFLAGYGAGCVLLANAAHEGGRLVHEFGVRAPLGTAELAAPMEPPGMGDEDDD